MNIHLTEGTVVTGHWTPDDLADLASVRAAANEIAGSETVDLLINNAGVMNLPQRRSTRDGFEMTFGTNHLGHFAFDAQVWPAVRRSAAARVVTVSAIAARWPSGKLEDLMSERRYRPMGAYAKSKRANVVCTARPAGTRPQARPSRCGSPRVPVTRRKALTCGRKASSSPASPSPSDPWQ
jgi:NAD(P)-dependent dehydrogenase (short-subunit alcohol dehydrogenase family)